MRVTVVGKNMSVGESLKNMTEKKLERFEKFFESDVEVRATLSHIREIQTAELTIFLKNGVILRSEDSAQDMEAALDSGIEKLIRQVRKHKTNMEKQFRKNTSIRYEALAEEAVDEKESFFADEPKIVRSKKFDLKPMAPEEAVLQMEMLGHNFFVFQNAETEQFNIVYTRKKGDYGLIEVEV
ncbi:MAG: ribosome-associated translation inhibitor RaiA [Bacillota bacterium]|nr:ribosome-associated translation inhibitor RaiA [Bacillota bacterium]